MYIHSTFQFTNKNENASYYKKLLKEVNPINLRRSNKFDVLAVWGACNCVIKQNYKETLNIYLASEYGVISGILKVLPTLDNKDNIIMPFDFLNTNGNNAGFNISSALKTKGESILINSNNFSFEQALKYAFIKSNIKNNFELLVGHTDESLDDTDYIKINTPDISNFIYCTNNEINAIAKIIDIIELNNEEVSNYLDLNNDYNIIKCLNADISSSLIIENIKKEENFILLNKTKSSTFIIKIKTISS
jgi:hypothetical protein